MCRTLLPIYNALWVYHFLQVEIQVWPNWVPLKPFKWPPVLEGNFCFVNLALLLAPSSVSGLISCVCVLSHSNRIGTLCSMYLPLPHGSAEAVLHLFPLPILLLKALLSSAPGILFPELQKHWHPGYSLIKGKPSWVILFLKLSSILSLD